MPKIKSHKGASKRFTKTSKSLWKHRSCNRSHINTKMSAKRVKNLRSSNYTSQADAYRLRIALSKV